MVSSAEKTIRNMLASADVKINGKRPWDIQIHNPKFYSRVLSGGSLALGESYMDGWWDCKSLDQFSYKVMSSHLERKLKISKSLIWNYAKAKAMNMQTKSRSKNVAQHHYDLGNDFYEDMLDKRMLYTSGYWKNANNLNTAQEKKLDLICKKIKLKKTDKVLDLGCGWGSFAKYAAKKYGCEVTAVNISREQVKYAREICKGLPVKVILSDYREVKGIFDKVVAIGLAEHIGYKNYKTFMRVAYKSLKKHGIFLVHTIGTNRSVKMCNPWFNKYIFPNGMLPSVKQIGEAAEGLFVMEDWHNFGADYDKTIMAWFNNFNKNWPKHRNKYGDKFYRMWEFYLLFLAGSFRARKMQLWQVVFSKDGVLGGYESVR